MDVVNLYFETFLKTPLQELGVFDEDSAERMIEYYERKKKIVLDA